MLNGSYPETARDLANSLLPNPPTLETLASALVESYLAKGDATQQESYFSPASELTSNSKNIPFIRL